MLETTPGVYIMREGGGYGDTKVNMRGFKSENVAVLVNGVSMNDMEWGGVYWSNWAGLTDVASSIQTQRGLGAAKVSTPQSADQSTSSPRLPTPAREVLSPMAWVMTDTTNSLSLSPRVAPPTAGL